MVPLSILFSAILTGCTEKDSEDTSNTDSATPTTDPVSYDYDCINDPNMCYEDTTTVSLGTAEFESYLDSDYQLSEENCQNICTDQSVPSSYNICSCSYIGTNELGGHDVACLTAECAVEGRGHGDVQKAQKTLGPTDLACWFARAFHAEASSVVAFLQLRVELQSHKAPQNLIDRCFQAAKEEVLHARKMSAFCYEERGVAPALSFGSIPQRSLYELALDNAVEGCVFETFSALKAHYQAANATDERIQSLMQEIARDETSHAQLAWDIHSWLMHHLSEEQQASIRQAQRQALAQLRQDNMNQLSGASAKRLGLPGSELAEKFAAKLAV